MSKLILLSWRKIHSQWEQSFQAEENRAGEVFRAFGAEDTLTESMRHTLWCGVCDSPGSEVGSKSQNNWAASAILQNDSINHNKVNIPV